MERMLRPRRPEQKMVPSQKPEPDLDIDKIDDQTDVDADNDREWDNWINDDSGTVEVPLTPLPQPEMGIHAPTPEMDDRDIEEQEKRRKDEERWKKETDPESVPRGHWEMKS